MLEAYVRVYKPRNDDDDEEEEEEEEEIVVVEFWSKTAGKM